LETSVPGEWVLQAAQQWKTVTLQRDHLVEHKKLTILPPLM